jgi:metal-sulfur cluster biosynthetic enzyme
MRALDEERRRAVREQINGVLDPCSRAMAVPTGIADMGIVEDVRIDGGRVHVQLLPTSPHCLFLGLFEAEIETRVKALPWVERVSVELTVGAEIWTEERMERGARERLARSRRARRPQAAGHA